MSNLAKYIPQLGLSLAHYTGKQVIDRVGIEIIQEAVASVLCGYNIRNLTETLTRRRLTLSTAAMVKTFIEAASKIENFSGELISILKKELPKATLSEKKLFLYWIAGLTGKSVQNVLRGDSDNLENYLDNFKDCIEKASSVCQKELGDLSGKMEIDKSICMIDWLLVSYLSAAIGTQTLAIRGSEKSMYGKLFEPLILSTLLQLLGFEKIGLFRIMSISMAIPTTEKNRSGPQRLKFPPWLPKLEPLPKRFFSRTNSKAPNCSFHVLINRMKQK